MKATEFVGKPPQITDLRPLTLWIDRKLNLIEKRTQMKLIQ